MNGIARRVIFPKSETDADNFYEHMFHLSFAIWLAFGIASYSFLFSSTTNYVFKVVKIFLVGANLIAAVFYYRYKGINRATIEIWTISAVAVAICLKALGLYYCFGIFFLVVGRHFEIKKTLRLSLYVALSSLVLIVTLSLIGVIPDYVEYNPTRIRHYLGFLYSLYSGQICFICVCMLAVVRGRHIKSWEVITCAVVLLFIYKATDDRLSIWLAAFVLLALVIVAIISRFCPFFSIPESLPAWLGRLANVVVIVLFLAPILITLLYSPELPFMHMLNKFLGNRLALGQNGIKEFGVSVIGQRVKLVGNGLDVGGLVPDGTYSYIDSTPVLFIIRYGLIFSLGFLVLQAVAIKTLWDAREYTLVFVLLVIALHSTIDDLCLSLYFNEFQFVYFGCLAVSLGESSAFIGKRPEVLMRNGNEAIEQ